ncbi:TerB family tellurite resistance protein [Puia dinghuensis]|uniref:TerB family tellurite resistance protein n=1 Tax=Puia dinghuensis TaxID=1792502 RepID=A0A8J2UI26_9BACT|nr:TerB family tellurite resistance protein [Puia dinghuensis]GGB20113.1 hypothetical protein GCM10011511_49800 [Puia dinghuensis]
MKRKICLTMIFALVLMSGIRAQGFYAQQLLLDVEKLGELKQILQDLKEGYQVLQSGYSTIRDVARGSFNLHKAFLDGLLAVSPTVLSYERIAEIADLQVKIVQRYQAAWSRFRQDGNLRPDELALLGQVYDGVIAGCLDDLNDLVLLVTADVLRASDAERMQEIDAIYYRVRAKFSFVDRVSNQTALLSLQRAGEMGDVSILKQLFGLK